MNPGRPAHVQDLGTEQSDQIHRHQRQLASLVPENHRPSQERIVDLDGHAILAKAGEIYRPGSQLRRDVRFPEARFQLRRRRVAHRGTENAEKKDEQVLQRSSPFYYPARTFCPDGF